MGHLSVPAARNNSGVDSESQVPLQHGHFAHARLGFRALSSLTTLDPVRLESLTYGVRHGFILPRVKDLPASVRRVGDGATAGWRSNPFRSNLDKVTWTPDKNIHRPNLELLNERERCPAV